MAMVNSEKYILKDNLWDPMLKSKREFIDNKESSGREQTLERIVGLQVAEGAIQQELLKDTWQRADLAEECIKELEQGVFNAYKHYINVIISYFMNSLVKSLTDEKKERLCRSMNRIALIIKFKNLFKKMTV